MIVPFADSIKPPHDDFSLLLSTFEGSCPISILNKDSEGDRAEDLSEADITVPDMPPLPLHLVNALPLHAAMISPERLRHSQLKLSERCKANLHSIILRCSAGSEGRLQPGRPAMSIP